MLIRAGMAGVKREGMGPQGHMPSLLSKVVDNFFVGRGRQVWTTMQCDNICQLCPLGGWRECRVIFYFTLCSLFFVEMDNVWLASYQCSRTNCYTSINIKKWHIFRFWKIEVFFKSSLFVYFMCLYKLLIQLLLYINTKYLLCHIILFYLF